MLAPARRTLVSGPWRTTVNSPRVLWLSPRMRPLARVEAEALRQRGADVLLVTSDQHPESDTARDYELVLDPRFRTPSSWPITQAAWRKAFLSWQAASVFTFGPLSSDLRLGIEFFPGSAIRDAQAAWNIARWAGENGGVLVDSWHYFRGAADPEHLRAIPAGRIVAVQFDDADQEMVGNLYEDTTLRRRLPGQGSFDLVGFIKLLDEIGIEAPVSVEILSPEQQGYTVAEAARLAHDTSRGVIARARE